MKDGRCRRLLNGELPHQHRTDGPAERSAGSWRDDRPRLSANFSCEGMVCSSLNVKRTARKRDSEVNGSLDLSSPCKRPPTRPALESFSLSILTQQSIQYITCNLNVQRSTVYGVHLHDITGVAWPPKSSKRQVYGLRTDHGDSGTVRFLVAPLSCAT